MGNKNNISSNADLHGKSIRQLAIFYKVSYNTMRSMLQPIKKQLWPKGSRRNYIFTPKQIQIITEHLGEPANE